MTCSLSSLMSPRAVRVLKVLKSTPYTVMDVEVGIPDNKPFEGEPTKWGADEGTRLDELELQVRYDVGRNAVEESMRRGGGCMEAPLRPPWECQGQVYFGGGPVKLLPIPGSRPSLGVGRKCAWFVRRIALRVVEQ